LMNYLFFTIFVAAYITTGIGTLVLV